MAKPVIILDPDWRQMDELFSPETKAALFATYDVVWGRDDGPIPAEILAAALPKAQVLIAATPRITQADLDAAPHLHTIIEVSGAFPDTIDYQACADRGIVVLSCAPGFRRAVAEMGLGMLLTMARGLLPEHLGFRAGTENWLADMPDRDFTVFGAHVGFVGFGQIAQELTGLLAPFAPVITAYDPWLPASVAGEFGVTLGDLPDVMRGAQCVFVAAVPTADNAQMIGAKELALMPDGALLVVLSRAHLVDFAALRAELQSGRISAAIDVFPTEPVAADDPLRHLPNVLLSPHRAAAVAGGRQLIGDLILKDLALRMRGAPAQHLGIADAARIASLAGIGDAASVAAMAQEREI